MHQDAYERTLRRVQCIRLIQDHRTQVLQLGYHLDHDTSRAFYKNRKYVCLGQTQYL